MCLSIVLDSEDKGKGGEQARGKRKESVRGRARRAAIMGQSKTLWRWTVNPSQHAIRGNWSVSLALFRPFCNSATWPHPPKPNFLFLHYAISKSSRSRRQARTASISRSHIWEVSGSYLGDPSKHKVDSLEGKEGRHGRGTGVSQRITARVTAPATRFSIRY